MKPYLKQFHYPLEKVALLKRARDAAGVEKEAMLEERVKKIITQVRESGIEAVLALTERFDQVRLRAEEFKVSAQEFEESKHQVSEAFKAAVEKAYENIYAFHKAQVVATPKKTAPNGAELWQKITPLERAGVYLPGGSGGKTPLISTLLMNVIPAQLAGVKEVVAVSPPTAEKSLHPGLLYGLRRLGIKEVYKCGGAQSIAALAYGVGMPAVDIIVGPGNSYVTCAKRLLFSKVMIDGVYGPSEIVIISDGSAPGEYIAADLLSQAEHAGDELAMLITTKAAEVPAVEAELTKQIPLLARRELINASLEKRGIVALVPDLKSAFELSNAVAPEHLEIFTEKPRAVLPLVKNAGAVFLGQFSSQPLGDYICGTNHVLPTGGAARFSSPLGVYTFQKRMNVVEYSRAALLAQREAAGVLAKAEGLTAHHQALQLRK